MKRPAGVTHTARISLFPFLAVLLCTMGALILLLVVIARQVRVQAADAAVEEQWDEELELERQTLQWRIEHLVESQKKTAAQLADRRLELSHLEEHTRRLRDQLGELEAARAELDRAASGHGQQRAQMRDELARLEAQIVVVTADVEQAAQEAEHPSSYAIIPYEGPNVTRRRPIYIECARDSVILQPEGIELTDEDFSGLLGPANPLASGVRAASEYLSNSRYRQPDDAGQAYPLLLVRPDGIGAYYAARTALVSWDAEFGYELIEGDWPLEFEQPDGDLAETVEYAVNEARRQEQLLAQAAPRLARAARPAFRAAPYRGGVIRDDQPLSGGGSRAKGSSQARRPSTPFGRAGHRAGRPADPGAEKHADNSGAAAMMTDGGIPGSRARSGPTLSAAQEVDPGAGGDARHADIAGTDHALQSDSPGSPGGDNSPSQDAASTRSQRLRLHAGSLAKSRGTGWGLPGSARGSVPITRPIRVLCTQDSLTILSEQGDTDRGKVILLGPQTADTVDELVSAVWDRIDNWGIAGQGMYWRPILSMQVGPHGATRFLDLRALLADSGLEVRAKKLLPSAVQTPHPTGLR